MAEMSRSVCSAESDDQIPLQLPLFKGESKPGSSQHKCKCLRYVILTLEKGEWSEGPRGIRLLAICTIEETLADT